MDKAKLAELHANASMDYTNMNNALQTHKTSTDHDGRYYTKTEMDSSLSAKAPKSTVDGHIASSTIHVTQVDKDAWNAKQNSLGAGTTTQYLRGDKTWAVPPDTTYSAMPISEANTGTATTSRVITASVLKSAIRTGAIDVVSSDPASLVNGQIYFLEV